jgi:hypothetical protein
LVQEAKDKTVGRAIIKTRNDCLKTKRIPCANETSEGDIEVFGKQHSNGH